MNGPHREVLKKLLKYQVGRKEAIRPCLVGYTASAKTATVYEVAHEVFPDYPILELPALGMLREDFYYPRLDGEWVSFYPPASWKKVVERPGVLFIDELSHVRGDTIAPLLKLLWEGRVGEHILHPESVIVTAMQPVDPELWLATEQGQALVARLCFLPTHRDWGWVERKTKYVGLFTPWAERDASRRITLPVGENNPRVAEFIMEVIQTYSPPKEERDLIIRGVMNEGDATLLIEKMESRGVGVDPIAIIKGGKALEMVEVLTPSELARVLPYLWLHGRPEDVPALKRTYVRIWSEGTVEDIEMATKSQYDHLFQACEGSPDRQIEVFGKTEASVVLKALEEAWDEVQAIKKAKKGEKDVGKKGKGKVDAKTTDTKTTDTKATNTKTDSKATSPKADARTKGKEAPENSTSDVDEWIETIKKTPPGSKLDFPGFEDMTVVDPNKIPQGPRRY